MPALLGSSRGRAAASLLDQEAGMLRGQPRS